MEAAETEMDELDPRPKEVAVFVLHTISSLHVGDQQGKLLRDGRAIRVPGSSLRGAFRARASQRVSNDPQTVAALLGVSGDSSSPGQIRFSDGYVLAFPVRTTKGIFEWVISPAAVEMFKLALEKAGVETLWEIPEVERGHALSSAPAGHKVMLEEFAFTVKQDERVAKIASFFAEHLSSGADFLKDKLSRGLLIINDSDFLAVSYLACEMVESAELQQTDKLPSDKALTIREYLPPETLIAFEVECKDDPGALQKLREIGLRQIQVGAEETRGKGLCVVHTLPA